MAEVEGFRLHAWGEPPRWEAFEVRDPGPGEVLVGVEACSVGLTVINCMNGNLGNSPDLLPLTPGHEVVGRVVSLGEGVQTPSPGDRIAAYFYLSCFSCRACLQGRESRCERLAGFYGVNMNGGYAPLTVLPAGNAIPLPEEISAADATVVSDAVATPVHVCKRRLALKPGDRVAVIGAGGGVGIHMVQVASVFGATVAGVDRTDDKLALVERHGAIPVDSAGFTATLSELSGEADAIIDLVGTSKSLDWGLGHLRTGGRLCVLTTFPGVGFEVEPRSLVFKESSIMGSRYASRAELVEAAELVRTGRVRPVVGATGKAEEVHEIHDALKAGKLLGRGALLWG